jgi:O-acetyl-ADP-ribose deacetylase (regulator of RNase III)
VPEASPLPELADIIGDLRLLRQRGLVRIRHTDLAALRAAAARTAAGAPPGGDRIADPAPVEAVLRLAVENLGGGSLGAAAAHAFGLNRGARDRPAHARRLRAAQEYGVSAERFRKYHERVVIEQVAEEILKLCAAPPRPARRAAPPPELAAEIRLEGRAGGARFAIVVHIEPAELIRGIDVLVAPANLYLELPQPYKSSVSAALRRAAAVRAADGSIEADVLQQELGCWLRARGRPGLPVAPGTVAPTSPGELAGQGIRRIYHAAIAAPRPGTNDYDVEPASIAHAARNVFAIARAERDMFSPPLRSIGFPLLGAGRGGLAPATSMAWLWAAAGRELRDDSKWDIHFITRRRATADIVIAGLSPAGVSGGFPGAG